MSNRFLLRTHSLVYPVPYWRVATEESLPPATVSVYLSLVTPSDYRDPDGVSWYWTHGSCCP